MNDRFAFDLQRFAAKTFTGNTIGDETGFTLSELFNSAGKAWLASDAERGLAEGQFYFWDKSALVELNPAFANAEESVAGAIQLVKGTYDDITSANGYNGCVIKKVTAVDAKNLINGAATFKTIGSTTILNPGFNSTITAGGTTLSFRGSTNREEDDTYGTYGYWGGSWEVGTKINTTNGKIKNVEAAPEEAITTADGVTATFANGGTATFADKSFSSVTAYADDDDAAKLSVTDGYRIVLEAETDTAGVNEGITAITAVLNGQAISSVNFASKTTSADIQFGGTANVGRDITIQKGTVNVDNITGSVAAPVTYHYSIDGNNVLDLTTATAATQGTRIKDVSVSKTGNARFLLATDIDNDGETITIGGTDYTFNDIGSNGGVFMVSSNAVTGFVFRDVGDSVTIPAGAKLKFYSTVSSNSTPDNLGENALDYSALDNLEEVNVNLTINSNGEYTVTKLESGGYEIEVLDSTEVTLGGATIEFTLPTTRDNRRTAPTSAKITISNDGVLESVTAGNTATPGSESASFDVGGTQIKFTGMNSDNVDEDFSVDGVTFATTSGEFNYVVGGDEGKTSQDRALQMTSTDDGITRLEKTDPEDTSRTDVILAQTTSEGDEEPAGNLNYQGVEYKYSSSNGNAYLTVDANGVRFVFVDEGDTLNIPEGGEEISLYYKNNLRTVDDIQELTTAPISDGESYSITMTKATTKRNGIAKFELFDMAAGDKVIVGESIFDIDEFIEPGIFEFSADGGKFLFDSITPATGFIAASGTVVMNQEAAEFLARDAFEINGTPVNITVAADETGEIVYNYGENSLAGLGNGSAVVDAGTITKIYASVDAEQAFTFGTGDDAKTFTAQTDGDFERGTAAYFTVDGATVKSFTFVNVDDEITGNNFSDITFFDGVNDSTGFAAPVVTENNAPTAVTVLKTLEDCDNDRDDDSCYAIIAPDNGTLQGRTVTFGDGTTLTFNNAQASTEILFSTEGKLLSVINLDNANNQVAVEGATGAVNIDGKEIEITGGGFTFTMLDGATPAITDVTKDTTIVKAAGVNQISTASGSAGIGIFKFGDVSYEVTGSKNNGVTFNIDKNLNVTSISGVDGKESVKIVYEDKIIFTDSDTAKATLTAHIITADATARTTAIKIVGNALDNSILGGAGNDNLYGGKGDDFIQGGAGNNNLYGQDGNDTLLGGAGNDTLKGGKGDDVFIYSGGNDLITDFGATDTLQIGNGTAAYVKETVGGDLTFTVGDDVITLKGAANLSTVNVLGKEIVPSLVFTNANTAKQTLPAEFVLGDAAARTKAIRIVGNALDNSILGGKGNDNLYGDDGADYLAGGAGADKLYGQNGNDTLWGGLGNDTLNGGKGADVFIYDSGNDVITDYASGDKISLGAALSSASLDGADAVLKIEGGTLTVKDAKELTLITSDGNEFTTIISNATICDDSSAAKVTLGAGIADADAAARTLAIKITGNRYDNSIVGGSGNDYIGGAKGDDTLWGGTGNDTLTGGAGADTFIYNSGEGKDVITDFADDDLLQITGTWSAAYNKSANTIAFKVGSTASAITLKTFTAATFNINGESYHISGKKLVK